MVFYFIVQNFFRFALVHSLLDILREIFLTSLGLFHSSLILLKMFLTAVSQQINLRWEESVSKNEIRMKMG